MRSAVSDYSGRQLSLVNATQLELAAKMRAWSAALRWGRPPSRDSADVLSTVPPIRRGHVRVFDTLLADSKQARALVSHMKRLSCLTASHIAV